MKRLAVYCGSATPADPRYIELARGFEPKDAPYLENHRGHLMFVKPDEKKFVTAELIARLVREYEAAKKRVFA